MPLINIKQKGKLSESPNVAVSFDYGGEYPVTVKDPFSPQASEDLQWYFEEHLRAPFVDDVRFENAAESVKRYGEALFAQIFRNDSKIYNKYREAIRGGLQTLRIDITGSPEFHQLHWEAMKDPEREPVVLHAPLVRLNEKPVDVSIEVKKSPVINILVVTARPQGQRDVNYRTISRPLVESLRQYKLPVKVDMVRPGTYRALLEHLSQSRDRYGAGHYHIIHFDLHGALLTYPELRKIGRVDPHTYKVILEDRYGRGDIDPPKTQPETPTAYLFFEAEVEEVQDAASADEIANLLREYQIPIAILNACQSGQQKGSSETSLGSRLLQAGTQSVIAMSYSVTVSAARLMMPALYRTLFEQQDLLMAVREGRNALNKEKKRQGYFDQQIKLEDWMLPVVYQCGGDINPGLPLRPMSMEEEAKFFSEKEGRYHAPEPALRLHRARPRYLAD